MGDVTAFGNKKLNMHMKISTMVARLNRLGVTHPHEQTVRWNLAFLILLAYDVPPTAKENNKLVNDFKDVAEAERKTFPFHHRVHYPSSPAGLEADAYAHAYDADDPPIQHHVQGLAAYAQNNMIMRKNNMHLKDEHTKTKTPIKSEAVAPPSGVRCDHPGVEPEASAIAAASPHGVRWGHPYANTSPTHAHGPPMHYASPWMARVKAEPTSASPYPHPLAVAHRAARYTAADSVGYAHAEPVASPGCRYSVHSTRADVHEPHAWTHFAPPAKQEPARGRYVGGLAGVTWGNNLGDGDSKRMRLTKKQEVPAAYTVKSEPKLEPKLEALPADETQAADSCDDADIDDYAKAAIKALKNRDRVKVQSKKDEKKNRMMQTNKRAVPLLLLAPRPPLGQAKSSSL